MEKPVQYLSEAWNTIIPSTFSRSLGEHEALIEILTSETVEGWLPPWVYKLVADWVDLHRDELLELWGLANQSQPLRKIDPLP